MNHLRELAVNGYTCFPAAAVPALDGAVTPWAIAAALLGQRPLLVEQQRIRLHGARASFASSDVFTPLHTDSQPFRGVPPSLQVMVCRRAAARGGETRLVDGWAMLEQIERDHPSLLADLFAVRRAQRFYFGAVEGPTAACKGGHFVLTHAPQPPPPGDRVGAALAAYLPRLAVVELRVEAGEVLLVDNHRMLHGRNAFQDAARDFQRLLVWTEQPLASHTRFAARAAAQAPEAERVVRPLPPELRAVIELLAGVAPAQCAAHASGSEADLYAWRTIALEAAARALVLPRRGS